MNVGDISVPFETRTDQGKLAYKIIYFKEKIPPHLGNLESDYQRFRAFTLNKKQTEKLNFWFEEAKNEVFIKIDPEYNPCEILK